MLIDIVLASPYLGQIVKREREQNLNLLSLEKLLLDVSPPVSNPKIMSGLNRADIHLPHHPSWKILHLKGQLISLSRET